MSQLPIGTLTFLYTDIEGSTVRWETNPTAIRAAVERHDSRCTGSYRIDWRHSFQEGRRFLLRCLRTCTPRPGCSPRRDPGRYKAGCSLVWSFRSIEVGD